MKKLILPIAAIAMVAFVACSDDSSPNSPSSSKTDVVPASVDKFWDTDNITCSETVNKCKTVVVKGYSEVAQCNGKMWDMQTLQQPLPGCENAAPATPAPAGNMVSCDVPGVMGECLEFPAGSAEAANLQTSCVSLMMGTLGTGCAK